MKGKNMKGAKSKGAGAGYGMGHSASHVQHGAGSGKQSNHVQHGAGHGMLNPQKTPKGSKASKASLPNYDGHADQLANTGLPDDPFCHDGQSYHEAQGNDEGCEGAEHY